MIRAETRCALIIVAAALPLILIADTAKAPSQPVPFSHKSHADAKIRCNMCHPNAAKAERAGLPSAAQCMACHTSINKDSPQIRQISTFHTERKPIPWVRLYRLPDFVFFSHSTHVNGNVACAACHGPVEQRETLAADVTHNMKTCMACHSARGVSNKCHVCHELGQ
jgi:hypothetical protein